MEVTSRVSKYVGGRKIIEIPKPVRDEFAVGEVVKIRKASERRKVR